MPIVLYRVLQESLTNVSRHAQATSVTATLRYEGPSIVLRITDDGRGISAAPIAQGTGFGLRGMMERLRAVGGELRIESPPAGGAEVVAVVPAYTLAAH